MQWCNCLKTPMTGMLVATMAVMGCVTADMAFAKKTTNTKMNMAAYKCEELLNEDEDGAGTTIVWIDGYLSGKTGDTTINLEFIEDLGKALGTECRKNPQAKVLEVVKRVTRS